MQIFILSFIDKIIFLFYFPKIDNTSSKLVSQSTTLSKASSFIGTIQSQIA